MALFKKTKKDDSTLPKKTVKKKDSKNKDQKAIKKEQKEKLVKKKGGDKNPVFEKSLEGKKREAKVASTVLLKPQITEKASFLQEKNQYIFQAFKTATKPEVKKAVEEVYGVNVEKVRIINVDRKRKRLGRTIGWKKGYKKAVVTIKKGQEIEIIPR